MKSLLIVSAAVETATGLVTAMTLFNVAAI